MAKGIEYTQQQKPLEHETPEGFFSEFDVDEAVIELRADCAEVGLELTLRKSRRRADVSVVRVCCERDDHFERFKELARQWQGLSYHQGLQGWYANFRIERVKDNG